MANIISVIKYEGDNQTFIWRHHITDFNLGTQLIVHESQEAVFFRDGKALESFGPGRHTLETQNLPLLKNHVNSTADGEHVFHSEVYFINLVTQLGVKWGTDSKIRMFDPISGLHLEIGACGTFNIKVNDGRKLLLKVVGTTNSFVQDNVFGSTVSAMGQFRGMVVAKVKNYLAKAIRENDINILEVDEHTEELSSILKNEINKVLDEYGMIIPEFFITNIVTPDDDPDFVLLKRQHAERYLKIQQQRIKEAEAVAATSRAEAEAQLKMAIAIGDASAQAEAKKLMAAAEAEEIRLKGLAEADVLRAKGGDYAAETARIVGKAAAENESSGTGGGMASDIVKAGVGVGVGVAVAKEVAGVVKDTVNPIATWDCPSCGLKGLTSNFCPQCGHKRGE